MRRQTSKLSAAGKGDHPTAKEPGGFECLRFFQGERLGVKLRQFRRFRPVEGVPNLCVRVIRCSESDRNFVLKHAPPGRNEQGVDDGVIPPVACLLEIGDEIDRRCNVTLNVCEDFGISGFWRVATLRVIFCIGIG